MGLVNEFKAFILRGSVVDLAVGVVIGVAFGTIVDALVKDMITPLIAAFGGQPDFSGLTFTINNSRFMYGDFINSIIAFVIIAAVVFFVVVRPLNSLMQRMQKSDAPASPATQKCPECLSEVPLGARKCAFCASPLAASA